MAARRVTGSATRRDREEGVTSGGDVFDAAEAAGPHAPARAHGGRERLRAGCRRVTDVPPASGRAVSRAGTWEGPIDESPPISVRRAARGTARIGVP